MLNLKDQGAWREAPMQSCMCVYIYVHVCMCIYLYTHIHICIYTCMHTYIYVHTYIYIYMCVYVYIHIHIYAYRYTYIYIHIYTYKTALALRAMHPGPSNFAQFVPPRHPPWPLNCGRLPSSLLPRSVLALFLA